MSPRALGASALLLSLSLSGAFARPAAAADDPAPPAPPTPSAPTATQIRESARARLAAGDVAGACGLFEQSYQASRARDSGVAPDDVLFDVADCHARQGRDAVAVAEFDQVVAGSGARADEARKRASALRAPQPPLPSPSAVGSPFSPQGAQGGTAGDTPTPPTTILKDEPPTRLGDFMDTRLSWTFGDDDVLHATGVAQPLSPDPYIGDRKQYRLFFDNLNSRFGGRENLTHLALYKKMPGFLKNLDTEASLVLRFDIGALATSSNNLNQALYDAGSFIRAFYHTRGGTEGKAGIGMTFWPIDTDRFRLGYLYDISWGGTAASINQSIFPRIQGSAPGAKIQYDDDKFNVYVGFKTALIGQVAQTLTPGTSEVEVTHVTQANYGVLGGFGVDANDYLHIDAGGGYFQQGRFDLPDVSGKPVYTMGGSARVVVHHPDMPAPQSIDFLLYRNDPNKPQVIFKPETYVEGKTTWAASLEFTNLFQNVKDFEATGVTVLQQARAAALQAQIKSSYLRASLTGIFRDLPFVLRNQPSMIPFESIPKTASTGNELFVAAGLDYFFSALHLTPGLGAGIQFPATFSSLTTNTASAPIERTVVIREQGNIAILPVNKAAVPIFQTRLSLKWEASRILSAIVWVQYVRDNNGTFVGRDPSEGTASLRSFVSPDFLGFGTSVQARF